MEAQELRIGNFLQDDKGQVFTVKGINELGCVIARGQRVLLEKRYDLIGIQLTEERMIKFGFKYTPCGISAADMWQGLGFWEIQTDSFSITLRADKKCKYGLRLQGYINSDYRYVHQLQNLVYALTGEELTLKENTNGN